jgi:hypothetical protein
MCFKSAQPAPASYRSRAQGSCLQPLRACPFGGNPAGAQPCSVPDQLIGLKWFLSSKNLKFKFISIFDQCYQFLWILMKLVDTGFLFQTDI